MYSLTELLQHTPASSEQWWWWWWWWPMGSTSQSSRFYLLHQLSSSSHACPELERSSFHEVLPMFSILSVFPCWVETKVVRLEICIQDAYRGMRRTSGRTPPILGQPLSALVISWRIHPCHDVSKESKLSGLDELSQLRWWAGSESYGGIGYMIRVWYAEDMTQPDIVKGIQSILSCKASVRAHVSEP